MSKYSRSFDPNPILEQDHDDNLIPVNHQDQTT